MTAPILVPAWPAVLRRGLPIVEHAAAPLTGLLTGGLLVQGVARGPWVESSIYAETEWMAIWPGGVVNNIGVSRMRLDLRDDIARDVCLRALWRFFRPAAPEPLSAPSFVFDHGAGHGWILCDDADDDAEAVTFRPWAGGLVAIGARFVHVAGLADGKLQEHDPLRALACVLVAAFGGS